MLGRVREEPANRKPVRVPGEKRGLNPAEITIASGSPGGRYQELGGSLARAIESQLGMRVRIVETEGSLANLHMLRAGRAQLAFYQPGTEEML